MMLFTLGSASESWPQVRLTADPPGSDVILGEKVTLTCQVTGSKGWKYIWTRETNGATSQLLGSSGQDGETYILQPVRKSDRGLYQCRAQRGSELSNSNSHSLRVHDVAQPVIRQNPPGPEWFSGETVTLECDIRGGSGWRYSWAKVTTQTRLQSLTPSSKETYKNYIVQSAKVSDSGEYICQAVRGSDPGFQSRPASLYLSVSEGEKPEAVITWTSHEGETYTGERISLSCRVRGASSGWKYLWYKDRQGTELSNPDNSSTDGSSYTIISAALSHSGQYWCRAQRGSFYSQYSDPLQLNIHVRPQAVLSLDTGFLQILTKDSLTLKCEVEGSSVGWSYTWYADGSQLPEDQDGQNFTVRSGNGSYHREYRCRGNRTEEPFYSTISNGLVPNNIISQGVENVSRIGAGLAVMILLSIILMLEFCGRPRCGATPRNTAKPRDH
ncbi:peroxidasin-like [Brienomyrus brachyistius]|uniref:peroxidasin-like n=1 Tax=Brienomyrus brachyistius TaxID=42636 RepID=UPI0020B454BE|nr:peroxidasin-like [Brienomyrus brachyistius]